MVRAAGLAEEAKAYNLANAARGWLPTLQAEGKAQVQSDVTSLPFDLSKLGISGLQTPKMSRDQYALSLSIQQPIYEGGRIKAAKQLAEAGAGVAQAAAEVNLYALREQVNQTYFGLLLIREQLRLNALLQDNIRRSLSQTEAMIRSGIAYDTDRDILSVALLQAEQAADGYKATGRAYAAVLSALTGLAIADTTALTLPPEPATARFNAPMFRRPELACYDARLEEVKMNRQMLDSHLRPSLGLFAQGGYGRPGLNMLKDKFALYGLVGLRLTWSISPYYTRKADLGNLRVAEEQIQMERDAFTYRQRTDLARETEEINRYKALSAKDAEIITLRERIRQSGEARYRAGTLSGTDLTRYLNDEQQARLDRAYHDLQGLLAQYELQQTLGKDAETAGRKQ